MTSTTLQLSDPNLTAHMVEAGRGEPLLLIHGVGMQAAAWEPQMAALAAHHHVIAVDMPGHGASSPLPASSQLPDFVNWLKMVVEARGCGPVNLAGHSMGALISGGFAAQHPDLVRRVALLNGVYKRDEGARQAVLARAREIAAGTMNIDGPLARWFDDTPGDAEALAQTRKWLQAMDMAAYATAYGAFAAGDATYADAWPDIACPALFLTGDDDPNSTPAMARSMANKAQRGKAIIIKGHKHMVNLTAIDAVNTALLDWLAEPEHTTTPQMGGEHVHG